METAGETPPATQTPITHSKTTAEAGDKTVHTKTSKPLKNIRKSKEVHPAPLFLSPKHYTPQKTIRVNSCSLFSFRAFSEFRGKNSLCVPLCLGALVAERQQKNNSCPLFSFRVFSVFRWKNSLSPQVRHSRSVRPPFCWADYWADAPLSLCAFVSNPKL